MVTDPKLIRKSADCNINRFMACMFDKNYKVLVIEGEPTEKALLEAWEKIYNDYLDKCSKETPYELLLISKIDSLEIRRTVVDILVQLQRKSITLFGIPYFNGFSMLAKYGYNLKWNEAFQDTVDFLKQLEQLQSSEKIYIVRKNRIVNELTKLKTKIEQEREHNKYNQQKERERFIVTMVTLQKHGYPINKEITTIEEFSIMIKEYNKYAKEMKEAHEAAKRH